jgi:hypothetical protein
MSDRSTAAARAWETRRIKRAISIRQPYAEQILRGIKVREYRSIPTKITERVFIYAGQKPGEWFDYDLLGFDRDDLPRGVLVGTVEVIGCEWYPKGDCYAYLLANPRRLRRQLKPDNQPQPIWFHPFAI